MPKNIFEDMMNDDGFLDPSIKGSEAEYSEKDQEQVMNMIEMIFPGTKESIAKGECPLCKTKIGKFRNEISEKEYKISGMCQKCQDDVFGVD